jgi:protease IV
MTRSGMIALALGCGVLTLAGCGPTTFIVGITPGDQKMTETVVQADKPATSNRVAIVDIAGMIFNGHAPGLLSEGENPLGALTERLDKARDDARVKAVILRVNSPGGTVTASDAMYREIMRFKETTHKPVVALMMDVAASGGYYVSCAADKIVAYPTTVTGSIGVIMQTVSVKEGLDRIGIRAQAITSGPNKEGGSPFSTLSDDQRRVFQAMVDDFYHRFTGVVKAARPNIPPDQWATVTDGRVVSGEKAVTLGLVDVNGDLRDAFAMAKQLAGIPAANLVLYHRPLTYVGSPYAVSPVGGAQAGTQINIAQFNLAQMPEWASAGFYYLWSPGQP